MGVNIYIASPPSAAVFSVKRVVNAVSIASNVARVVNREVAGTKSIPWHKIDICYSRDFLSAHSTVQSSEESTVSRDEDLHIDKSGTEV